VNGSSNKSILDRFSTNAFFVLISRIGAFVAVFGINAILARQLIPEEFGAFALLFSIATVFCLIASCGMNRALVKILADESYRHSNNDLIQILRTALWTSLIAGSVIGVLAGWIVGNFLISGASTTSVAMLFAAIVVVRNVQFVFAELARGFHESKWSNMFGGPAGGPAPHLLFLLVLLCQMAFGASMNLPHVLVTYLCCFVFTLPLLLMRVWSLKSEYRFEEERKSEALWSWQGAWAIAVPLMLTQAFGVALSQADIWIAGAVAVPAALAIYCAAQRLLAFLTIPLQISSTAVLPLMPELVSNGKHEQLQKVIGLSTFISGLPAIAIGAVLLLFPETVLAVAFGDYYTRAATILQILVAGQLACVLTGPCETLLMMSGHQNKTLAVNAVVAVAILIAGTLALNSYGMLGLAITMATATVAQNVFNCWLARQTLGIATYFQPSHLWDALEIGMTYAGLKKETKRATG